jgi:hypothetical protein
MADAEDLKSSGDFSSCGFDSHPGHHSNPLKNRLVNSTFFPVYIFCTFRLYQGNRILAPRVD